MGDGIPRCRTSPRWDVRCGTRATSTRRWRTGASTWTSRGRSRDIPNINYVDNGATHDYHGVTIEAERRISRGLFFQVAYTAARDTGEDSVHAIENPFDLERERGRDLATPAHRLTSAVMYDLPFGRDRKWLTSAPWLVDLALGGWQVSVVGYLQSGGYLTPTISVPDPTGTRFTTTATRPLVTLRPDQLRDPDLDDPTIARWFDVAAYGAPPIGSFGTAERGSVEGPGLNLWHFGLHKKFRLSDGAQAPTLRIELTTTNIFNHPQWAAPNMNVTPSNVSAGRDQRHRRHRRVHSAGRHAADAAGFPAGVVRGFKTAMVRLKPDATIGFECGAGRKARPYS